MRTELLSPEEQYAWTLYWHRGPTGYCGLLTKKAFDRDVAAARAKAARAQRRARERHGC